METTAGTDTTVSSDVISDATTTNSTVASDVTTTEQTTTASTVEVEFGENEVVTLEVGSYVKLIYNPAYCQITTNVEQSVGSREKVSLYYYERWIYV